MNDKERSIAMLAYSKTVKFYSWCSVIQQQNTSFFVTVIGLPQDHRPTQLTWADRCAPGELLLTTESHSTSQAFFTIRKPLITYQWLNVAKTWSRAVSEIQLREIEQDGQQS